MSAKMMWKGWMAFWFSPVPLLNLAFFRIAFCLSLFLMYWSRQKDLNLFFSDQGILPKSLASLILPEFYRPAFVLSFWPDSWVGGLHLLFLFFLFLYMLGLGGKILGLICVFFNLAFLQRNYGIVFGADQIGSVFLLYLALTQSCSRFSIRNWQQQKEVEENSSDLWTPVFYRLIQIQLCLIYVYSGFDKLKGSLWWDGTALWRVFANSQIVILDLSWMRNFPLVIVVLSFLTVLFEIYFPVLVFNSRTRKYILATGVFFHTGIGIFMALFSFTGVMLAPYLLFVKTDTLKLFLNRIQRRSKIFKLES